MYCCCVCVQIKGREKEIIETNEQRLSCCVCPDFVFFGFFYQNVVEIEKGPLPPSLPLSVSPCICFPHRYPPHPILLPALSATSASSLPPLFFSLLAAYLKKYVSVSSFFLSRFLIPLSPSSYSNGAENICVCEWQVKMTINCALLFFFPLFISSSSLLSTTSLSSSSAGQKRTRQPKPSGLHVSVFFSTRSI